MSHYDKWMDPGNLNIARERILSGWGSRSGPMPADLGLIAEVTRMEEPGKVLDFGCGVGRNLIPLSLANKEVVGFDFPAMLELIPEYLDCAITSVRVESDWSKLCKESFDFVYVSLVWQHLLPEDVDAYSEALVKMTPTMYVHTRVVSDFDKEDGTRNKIRDMLNKWWDVTYVFPHAKSPHFDRLGDNEHYAMKLEVKT